ncbi:MAG: DUF4062 domain-containing protein [Armatimonadetes bacterium]|nr:DUF4062 domain-containing protein [Armatimonadota bacterium]
MAKPRVFVSSTYFDLKHIRTSLERFIESLGYEAVGFERGNIAYTHEAPLDQSCYRDVRNSDIFVLIVGGHYGSPASTDKSATTDAPEAYDSVTKQEYKAAVEQDIPIYILVERQVYTEYQTYCRNRSKPDVDWAQVDSEGVYRLLDEILAQPRNNPVHEFDASRDIEDWLREQWAGYFRELLQRAGQQQQLASLSEQVSQLRAITTTLQTYLEEVVRETVPDQGEKLIEQERRRRQEEAFARNNFLRYLLRERRITAEAVAEAMQESATYAEFRAHFRPEDDFAPLNLGGFPGAIVEIQAARSALGLPLFTDLPSLVTLETVLGSSSQWPPPGMMPMGALTSLPGGMPGMGRAPVAAGQKPVTERALTAKGRTGRRPGPAAKAPAMAAPTPDIMGRPPEAKGDSTTQKQEDDPS